MSRLVSGANRYFKRAERRAFRSALGFGNRVSCSVCGWHGVTFAPSAKPRVPNRICPNCKSNERYRAFDAWFRAQPWEPGLRILEIAPTHMIEPTARSLGFEYTSLDLHSARARVLGDLCATPFRDGAFDLVVCFHVLEHIPDDLTAMSEIGRILSDRGTAVVVVPWEPGRTQTFEVPDADPADYQRLYGQSDHVRTYGRDVSNRLTAAGLEVDEKPWSELFTSAQFRRYALDGDDDRFWVCSRRVSDSRTPRTIRSP